MSQKTIDKHLDKKYEFGFTTDIEQNTIPPGLDENVIKIISQKKDEPEWILKWRLNAFSKWKKMKEPSWAKVDYPNIDPNCFDIVQVVSISKTIAGKQKLITRENIKTL